MKSKLQPASWFCWAFEGRGRHGQWDYSVALRLVKERDRQWERMLATLYKEWKKRR